MKINVLPVGAFQTNCYILESDNKNAMIIDAGADADSILAFCEGEELTIKMLVFTHGHFDHIGATTKIVNKTAAKTYIHSADEELMLYPQKTQNGFFNSFGGYQAAHADVCYNDGDIITLDDITLKAMHTKGHTKGSCLLIGAGVIFTGDTIFAGSVGRTDLYGASGSDLLESIKRIVEIDGDYTLLTGHGSKTTLSKEKCTNPYMGVNYDDIF